MQKLKDNWVILLAVTVVVAIVTVVIIKHTKLSVVAGTTDLQAHIDLKS